MLNKQIESVNHPKASLATAIETLGHLAEQSQGKPDITNLVIQENKLVAESPFLLKRMFQLLVAAFSTKARDRIKLEKVQIQKVVLEAIDEVKRNYLLIEAMRSGSESERSLAHETLETVSRYNKMLKTNENLPISWRGRLTQFMFRCIGVHSEPLPVHTIDLPYGIPGAHLEDIGASSLQARVGQPEQEPTLKQEMDVIRMKANTLLRDHGICETPEALKLLQKAAIQTNFDPSAHTSTVSLTLNMFPGMTVRVVGSFLRHDNRSNPITPIQNSFQLSLSAPNLGFPHPSHTGWALPAVLVPIYPQRMHELPHFGVLYQGKQEIMRDLLPGGKYFHRATQLLEQRKSVFSQDVSELLRMHQELANIFVEKSVSASRQHRKLIVDSFFAFLGQQEDPIGVLAKTYQIINDAVILDPHVKLQEAWVGHQVPELYQQDLAYSTAKQLLSEAGTSGIEAMGHLIQEESARAFATEMAKLLGPEYQEIVLQYWSETLRCLPPVLSPFAQKLQITALLQLKQLIDELTDESFHVSLDSVKHHLSAEIALFESGAIDPSLVLIVQELEHYYRNRFVLLSS